MRILIAIAVAGILGATLVAQRRPLPIVDVHLHATAADGNGPPPLAMCTPFTDWMRDSKDDWNTVFLSRQKTPPCRDPVWSPTSDDSLMNETLAVMRRRNIVGVVSGSLERVRQWRLAAPDRVIPAVPFEYRSGDPSPEALRRLHERDELAVLAEIGNQYEGISPSDPLLEPYLAMAEAQDIPVGIHIGTGPPGAPYLPGLGQYRAKLHSPLLLEEALVRHPRLRVYIMHAGWPMLDDLLAGTCGSIPRCMRMWAPSCTRCRGPSSIAISSGSSKPDLASASCLARTRWCGPA